MADQIYNVALGRIVQWYINVDTNDPANAVLVIVVINTTDTDAAIKDVDTLAALVALANTAEVTNTNYARKILDDTDLVAFAPDDVNDRTDLDVPDQTWTGVAAGDAWTDLEICYDSDSTGGTDALILPGTHHDFSITPNGGDITMQVAAAGFARFS